GRRPAEPGVGRGGEPHARAAWPAAVPLGSAAVTRSAKAQRQHRIAKLLERHRLGSQGEVVELLAADGVVATQATVSRDLEELGAVKVRAPGGETVYAIPQFEERPASDDHLRRVLA